MTEAIIAGFAQSYRQARALFLNAAQAAGLELQTQRHPLPGVDGEDLALDVARAGAADAHALLIVSSACHGVEGFCGSGIQVALLADAGLMQQAQQAGVALLFVHALNPWGFSWWRRTTQENVDLNRNFFDFDAPLPVNADYRELARALVPESWPPPAAAETQIAEFIARRGMPAFQAAVSGGQHDDAQGLFYAGHGPTWSHHAWRRVLQQHGQRCARLAWIDLHTGLGPSGHGERIFCARDDAPTLARTRAWWGAGVTSIYDGSSSSARLAGMAFEAIYDECPQAEYTGIALEYGTLALTEVMTALRADQWLENHPQAPAAQRAAIKRATRDAFYTDTPAWKLRVVEQAQQAVQQAVLGLSA